jgi:lipopolysaccharide assembly outer membrane protein LptD (OstA)
MPPGLERGATEPGGAHLRLLTTSLIPVVAALLAVATPHASGQDSPGTKEFIITADEVEAEEGDRGKIVWLERNVTIVRGLARLRGSHGAYYESEGHAIVYGDVTGTDAGRSVACDTLRYDLNTDTALLIGNASYSDSTATTYADLITLLRPQNVAICEGSVRTVASDGTTELLAGRLVYDFDTGEGRASVGPYIMSYDADGELSSKLTADVVEYNPGGEEIRAFGDVVIEREDIVARARTASIGRSGGIFLEGSPTVEQQDDTLSGDRIFISVREGQVSRVNSFGDATATYTIEPEEEGDEPSHGLVQGDTLTMFMHDGAPILTTLRGHSRSVHFVGATGEKNIVDSRAIDVLFTEGRISRVVFHGGAAGTYYFLPEGATPGARSTGLPASPDSFSLAGADSMPGGASPPERPGSWGGAPPPAPAPPGPAMDKPGAATSGGASPPPASGLTDSLFLAPSDYPAVASVGDVASGSAGADSLGLAGAPADTSFLDLVRYSSDAISYYVARNRIVLSGAARVEYEDTVLNADEVVFDPDEQLLDASGSPDLREKSDRLVGESLEYDLERKTGSINGGVTTFEEGLYYGDRIVRESDGTLKVRGGTYTTCSNPEPHYSLVSHRMKVYMDDKVVAKPVILYIGKIPVLALPFYVFPIRTERHSGFLLPQIELGLSQGGGRFIRNFGYYFAPSDYWDTTAWADFYEETRWIVHAEARYKLRYVLSGSVQTSFMQQLLYDQRRWDLKLSHRQELGRVWTAGASGDFRSDATYASDSNQSIQESVNRSLHSQVWMRGRWSSRSVGITLDRREDLDSGSISELLPKLEVTATQQPIVASERELPGYAEWLKKVSFGWSARAVNDRDRSGGSRTARQGLGVKGTVRGSEKLLGWLNMSPRLGFEQDWYDRDREGNKLPGRFTYDAGISVGTTVYGTFFPGKMGLSAVRHIIEPSASYSWTPEFDSYFSGSGIDRFYSFSGFGATPRSRRSLSLSLVNKLQVKLGEGEAERKIDNLVRLSTSTSYNFKADDRPWSDLTTGLEVRPGQVLSMRWNARHDAYDGAIKSSNVTATLDLTGQAPAISSQPWEERVSETDSPVEQLRQELAAQSVGALPGNRPWDANLTFRYSRGADPSNASYWFDGSVAFAPAEHWRLNYSLHYDLEQEEVASQEYTIYRDMHCWEAQFTRRYYDQEWQFYFRINVKALPEIQAEAGKNYLQRSVR